MLNIVILVIALCMAGVAWSAPMGTAFTYQGRLSDANSPADGLYDFEFEVYDALDGGTQQGSTISKDDVDVIDSYFTAELDFGSSVFTGDARWLQVAVRPGASSDPCDFATLSPRQELTPTPHAIYAENAGSDNDWAVSGDDMYSIHSGNVGVGTTTPAHKLEVKAPTNQALRLSTESTNSHVDIQGTPTGSGSMRLNVFGGANAITFNVNNTEKVRMNSNGDVGIGTASPGARLEVNGQVKITGGSPGADKVLTSDAGGLATWQTPSATADSDWQVSGSDMYSIPSGNVGIGTTSPAAKLDVSGNITATGGNSGNWNTAYSWGDHATAGYLTSESDPVFGTSAAAGITSPDITNWNTAYSWGDHATAGYLTGYSEIDPQVGANTTNYIPKWDGSALITGTIYDNGNVGIGTPSPAAKLDVSGDISASSVYKIGGNTVLSVAGGNTLVGIAAGAVNTGNCNTFSGYQAGYSNTTGYGNTFSGNQAGYNNTEGYANTFSGYWTGFNNTTGHGNTFSGLQAGYSNTTGIYNTFSGHQAGVGNTTGHDNTFSGYMAGYSNTTGNYNTFSGYQAGRSNTTGHDNTFSGYMAGYSNTTGNYNTFSGDSAGYFNTTGYANTFSGYMAGYSNTTGNYNTFSGDRAGYSNMEGGANTFTGHMAGYNNTTGCCNTFSGLHAGLSNTEGTGNTFSGHQAGLSNTEGTGNTFSGASAGYYNTTGTGNVFIGSNAGYYETGSTKLYIDNSGTSTPLIHGDFSTDRVGINRVSTANTLEVGGNASKTTAGGWLANSDARIKTDIQTVTGALDTLDKVRLVSFKYTDDYRNQHRSIEDQTYLNVVAQEFAEVFPDYVKSSGEKLHNGEEILQVDSYPLTIYSAAAVQELHTIVKAKDAEIAALKKHNDQMEARLATMEAAISKLISSEQGGQL